ncbi:MAG TPA: nucleotide pyrophosphatase [Bacteroidales bacterium]|nr:nucleotide pyrophosphatase [Bacteroidales bacterium]
MKNILHLTLVITILTINSCSDSSFKANRVIIIALDGISVEGLNASEHPNLERLFSEGVLSLNTRVVMPSVTLPNWTSHLTGSGPEQHGVTDNSWEINNHKLPSVDKDPRGFYPSILKVLKEQVPSVKTAFYYNWNKLIYPYNQEYIDEVSYEENDGYLTNYEKAINFIISNKENPTFVFLYSVHTDHAGHNYNWMSPEYIQSIEEADLHIGEFLTKLKNEGLYEDSHIMFLSDHGGIEKGHGGLSTTEMEVPWFISGPGINKDKILAEPNNTVNTAATIAYLFGCTFPLSWTGEIPMSIFE